MGFCYTHDGKLCCDVCGDHPARKIHCPVNWCQAYAACAKCKAKVKAISHDNCRARQAETRANLAKVRAGGLTIRLYEDASTFEPAKIFWRPCVEWLYHACSDIFSKTWLDQPDIEQLKAMGHTITYGKRGDMYDEKPPATIAPAEQLGLFQES